MEVSYYILLGYSPIIPYYPNRPCKLQWLQAVSPQNSRLARWAIRLAEYDFELQHRSGKNNGNADDLSRCLITSCAASTESTSESTSPLDVDNLIAVKTLADFEASFAVEVDLFSNPNCQLSSSATEPESDDELDPDHLIALKTLHPIIECFLELSSENSKKQGKFPGYYTRKFKPFTDIRKVNQMSVKSQPFLCKLQCL